MPSKGISFQSLKHRADSSSDNPRTIATRRWEEGLSGLTLALHRIDKAASVARSRAIGKVRKTSEWSNLTPEIQKERIQKVVDDANKERDVKKQRAMQMWTDMHGDGNRANEIGEREAQSIEVEEGREAFEEDTDDEESGEEMSELDISEAEEGEEDGDELPEEARQALHEDLGLLRRHQGEQLLNFLDEMEEIGKARAGEEIPDDYEFGSTE